MSVRLESKFGVAGFEMNMSSFLDQRSRAELLDVMLRAVQTPRSVNATSHALVTILLGRWLGKQGMSVLAKLESRRNWMKL